MTSFIDPTTNSDGPPVDIAIELERIRRSVDVGFSDMRGSMNLLLQRADQTDQRMKDQDDATRELDTRLTAVEQKMWAAFGAATVIGTIGGAIVPILFK